MRINLKTIIIILCTIVLTYFAFNIWDNSRGKYKNVTTIPVTLPYNFKTVEGERLFNEGFDNQQMGEYEKAISSYKKAIDLEPANPRIFFELSNCYSNIDQIGSSLIALDSAIALDSTYAGFYNNRGMNYYILKYDNLAIHDFEKAIRIDSTNWIYYSNLALALNSKGDKEKACNTFRLAKKYGLKITDNTIPRDLVELNETCD